MGKNSRLGDWIHLEHLIHWSTLKSTLGRLWRRCLNWYRLALLLLNDRSFWDTGGFRCRYWLPIVITVGVHKRFARCYSSNCSLCASGGNLLCLWSGGGRRATLDASVLRQLVVAVKFWVVEASCVSNKTTKVVSLKFVA